MRILFQYKDGTFEMKNVPNTLSTLYALAEPIDSAVSFMDCKSIEEMQSIRSDPRSRERIFHLEYFKYENGVETVRYVET